MIFMTRLTSGDVRNIDLPFLKKYDTKFKETTGKSLKEFAFYLSDGEPANNLNKKIAVVPVTAGLGVIDGFCSAVEATLRFMGCHVFTTSSTDTAGLYEAFQCGPDLIFSGDDNVFAAFNLNTKKVIENSYATGRAYAAALELAAGGVQNKTVLVIGAGRVGTSAIDYLINKGARVHFIDCDAGRVDYIQKKYPSALFESDLTRLPEIRYVLLAAPSKDILDGFHVCSKTIVSCPAIPVGLTDRALEKISDKNLIHDPLPLGVISMLMHALVNE